MSAASSVAQIAPLQLIGVDYPERCYHLDTSMSSILIRDVAPRTLRALKLLARSHHRSLQGELHAILARAARMAPPETEEQRLQLVTVKTERSSGWSRDTIYGDDGR